MATYGTISANGDTDTVFVDGPFNFIASGTWGSGTFIVKILSANGSTWKNLSTATAITTDETAQILYDIAGGHYVKATLAGATGPSLAWEFLAARAIA